MRNCGLEGSILLFNIYGLNSPVLNFKSFGLENPLCIHKTLGWRTQWFWKNVGVSVRSFWTRTWALQSTGFQNQNAFCFLNKDVVLFSKNKTSHDITWRPLKIHENPCKPMKAHENPWNPMKNHEGPWIHMICLKFPENNVSKNPVGLFVDCMHFFGRLFNLF